MISTELQSDEFCESILDRFSSSTQEDHQHLCAVLGTMSQELKDQNIPLTPVAYFGAACSSLDRLSCEPDPAGHVIESFMTILSLVLPKISPAILKKKGDFTSVLLLRVLRSSSVTAGSVVSGLKCVSQLLITRDPANWSDLSQLYPLLLVYMTDSRSKVFSRFPFCKFWFINSG